MLTKSRNFSPTKCESTYEKDGFGWAPGYEKKFEGAILDPERYEKNYARMQGLCRKCFQFDSAVDKADGSHCLLGKGKKCLK